MAGTLEAWQSAETAFKTARSRVMKYMLTIHEADDLLLKRWPELEVILGPRYGIPDHVQFDASEWPSGEQLRDALHDVREAWRALVAAYNSLPNKSGIAKPENPDTYGKEK